MSAFPVPTAGGSYLRDDVTGELVWVAAFPAPVEVPAVPEIEPEPTPTPEPTPKEA